MHTDQLLKDSTVHLQTTRSAPVVTLMALAAVAMVALITTVTIAADAIVAGNAAFSTTLTLAITVTFAAERKEKDDTRRH